MNFKRTFCIFFLSLLAINPLVANQVENQEVEIEVKTLSRAFGHILAKNLNETPGFQFDMQNVILGIKEELENKPSPMSEVDYETAMSYVQQKCFESLSTTNLQQAEDFLEQNLEQSNIIELVPGKLQYSVLEEGCGDILSDNSSALIHYTGRYIDQTVFSSSEEAEPLNLQLCDTISGFKQGLIGAKAGETRRLYVHPDFGYGSSDVFLPNSLMIFDVKVLDVNSDSVD